MTLNTIKITIGVGRTGKAGQHKERTVVAVFVGRGTTMQHLEIPDTKQLREGVNLFLITLAVIVALLV